MNKGNFKKVTRHMPAHLSLCAKYRKTNDAKSRKCRKTSIWAIFWQILRPNISKLQIFLKNRFHSNWRSCLVLTSGQKPKKSLGVFEKNIEVSDFWLIWRLFREYLQIKNFFSQKSGPVTNHFSSNFNKNWTFFILGWKFNPFGSCDLGGPRHRSIFEEKYLKNDGNKLYNYQLRFQMIPRLIDFSPVGLFKV